MANVTLNEVSKVYPNGYQAAKSLVVDIKDGEFVVLVGPSGCGKSTMLRMIAGLEEITEGELLIGDKVVNRLAPKDRDIAMVFQNYALYPHLNVRDNLGFALKQKRVPKESIRQRVETVASLLELEGILDRKPKQLSGGQRQRVAVGRAIARDAEVYLFDEPLSNLDASLRVAMRAEIMKLHRQLKKTMIYVTHDQTEAMTMGDRIVVLKDSEIQQVDTPLALYRGPVNKFVASFIGSPSMNFVAGKIRHSSDTTQFCSNDGKLILDIPMSVGRNFNLADGMKVELGVRPEHVFQSSTHGLTEYTDIEVEVDYAEHMGNEVIVYSNSVGDLPFLVRDLFPENPKADDKVSVAIDLYNLHFFDLNSGASLHRNADERSDK